MSSPSKPTDTPPVRLKPVRTPEERRELKREKREKQRAANVGRAHSMHEARMEAGPVPPMSGDSLPRFNVGCSGWFYWHWRDVFYPPGMPTKDWFPHYRAGFGTVELNAPFYSWPTVNAVKTWLKQVGSDPFVYTVKACELITHVKKFTSTKTLVRDFGFIADLLGERMGCFLYQLPPSYDYTPARLRAITSQLDPARRNVVEFRHKSWWNEKVYEAFRQSGVIFCSCSAPRLPDELITTGEEVYVRFHGKAKWYQHDYAPEELAVWRDRVEGSGCRRVWAYFNNDRNGFALKNARDFLSLLRREGSVAAG